MTTSKGILPSRKPWTAEEDAMLKARYTDEATQTIAMDLGRRMPSVYQRAIRLGLKKSKAYYQRAIARRLDGAISIATRFKKGHATWNKGIHYHSGGRSVETRFKHGNKPRHWAPIGSERVSKDGYLQRKVTDTGYGPRDWVGIHVLVWIEHNGPVPEDHVVLFRDGNKENLDINNLDCITRQEQLKRVTVHNLPEELRDVIWLNGVLRRKIHGK